MHLRFLLRLTATAGLVSLLGLAALAKQPKAAEQYAEITVTVVRDSNEKPVSNAAVIFHALNEKGEEIDSMQFKTDEDGQALAHDILYGRQRLQVIAHGLQTYGEDIVIDQPRPQFTVRLKKPAKQISIY